MFSPLFFPFHIFRVLIGVIIQRINKVLRHVVHLCCIQYRNSIIIHSIMSIAVLNTSYHCSNARRGFMPPLMRVLHMVFIFLLRVATGSDFKHMRSFSGLFI